jgi:hypothetical protein
MSTPGSPDRFSGGRGLKHRTPGPAAQSHLRRFITQSMASVPSTVAAIAAG